MAAGFEGLNPLTEGKKSRQGGRRKGKPRPGRSGQEVSERKANPVVPILFN
jgi:hypothetical protein